MIVEAVDMGVDVARSDLATGVIADLAVGGLGHILAENAILDHEVAVTGNASGR